MRRSRATRTRPAAQGTYGGRTGPACRAWAPATPTHIAQPHRLRLRQHLSPSGSCGAALAALAAGVLRGLRSLCGHRGSVAEAPSLATRCGNALQWAPSSGNASSGASSAARQRPCGLAVQGRFDPSIRRALPQQETLHRCCCLVKLLITWLPLTCGSLSVLAQDCQLNGRAAAAVDTNGATLLRCL